MSRREFGGDGGRGGGAGYIGVRGFGSRGWLVLGYVEYDLFDTKFLLRKSLL
jgi:hypothetical protein